MRQSIGLALLALGACALGCGRPVDPAAQVCGEVLGRKHPEARALEVALDPAQGLATITFEIDRGVRAPERGELACWTEASGSEGALRLRAASLDGRALPQAELAVINADLLLADLRRADPYRKR